MTTNLRCGKGISSTRVQNLNYLGKAPNHNAIYSCILPKRDRFDENSFLAAPDPLILSMMVIDTTMW